MTYNTSNGNWNWNDFLNWNINGRCTSFASGAVQRQAQAEHWLVLHLRPTVVFCAKYAPTESVQREVTSWMEQILQPFQTKPQPQNVGSKRTFSLWPTFVVSIFPQKDKTITKYWENTRVFPDKKNSTTFHPTYSLLPDFSLTSIIQVSIKLATSEVNELVT